jgi:hypothetical protein
MKPATRASLIAKAVTAEHLAALLGCLDQHASDLMDGRVEPTAREYAVMRLCANVPLPRLADILARLTASPEWHPVPGFTKYEAHASGMIRRRGAERGGMPGVVLKHTTTKTGHHKVNVGADAGGVRSMMVHRLICMTFHGPPPEPSAIVCHRNDVPSDNRSANLSWGTPLTNASDRIRNAPAKSGTYLTQRMILQSGETPSRIRKLLKAARTYRLNKLAQKNAE